MTGSLWEADAPSPARGGGRCRDKQRSKRDDEPGRAGEKERCSSRQGRRAGIISVNADVEMLFSMLLLFGESSRQKKKRANLFGLMLMFQCYCSPALPPGPPLCLVLTLYMANFAMSLTVDKWEIIDNSPFQPIIFRLTRVKRYLRQYPVLFLPSFLKC